jgi:Fe-S-cluster containining protein
MSVSIKFTYRGQQQRLEFEKPPSDATTRQLVSLAHEIADGVSRTLVQVQAEMGQPISCRDGCGACCRYLVGISAIEARDLMSYIRGMLPEERAELQERFRQALERLEQFGLLERVRAARQASVDEVQQLVREYPLAGAACPFLVNESCSIYERRPAACRQLLVVSPPEICATPPYEDVQIAYPPLNVKAALRAIGETGRENPAPIPLVLLLEWKDNLPERQQTTEAWILELLMKADPRYFD